MWSEEMDDNIRNAAENDIPAYDEKTWAGMEHLLQKHLPQKKKRRGLILFLFLGLLLVVPGIFLINKYTSGDTTAITQQDKSSNPGSNTNGSGDKQATTTIATDQLPTGNTADKNVTGTNTLNNNNTINSNASTPVIAGRTQTIISPSTKNSGAEAIIQIDNSAIANKKNNTSQPDLQKKNTGISKLTATAEGATTVTNSSIGTDKKEGSATADITTAGIASGKKQTPVQEDIAVNKVPATNTTDKNVISNNDNTDNTVEKPVLKKIDSAVALTTDPVKKDQKPVAKKKDSKFSINLSIGADLTSVGLDKVGKVKSEYGIGVGYAINKRFGVRAGFFVGRKIYSADSTNYHTIYTSGGYNYKLYKIDANCLVYEIPVNATYSFGITPKHNWFVSSGLSSYIMKSEDYKYIYKAPPGSGAPSYNHDINFDNANKHFFSILNISGGYQYNFTNRLSFLAEPYLKIPVSGIGAGKVKLNSAGVLFTLSVRPF